MYSNILKRRLAGEDAEFFVFFGGGERTAHDVIMDYRDMDRGLSYSAKNIEN